MTQGSVCVLAACCRVEHSRQESVMHYIDFGTRCGATAPVLTPYLSE